MQSAVVIQKSSNPKRPNTGSFFGKGNRSAINQQKKESTSTSFFNIDSSTNTGIQTKLSVGKPADKYEVEADAIADTVVQKLQRKENNTTPFFNNVDGHANIQTKCDSCEEEVQTKELDQKEEDVIQPKVFLKTEDSSEEEVQPKCDACDNNLGAKAGGLAVNSSLENQLTHSKEGGRPLSKNTQKNMGKAFGKDFSGVKIHTGSSAVQMNEDLNAQAFTHGKDIYFNNGKYDPDSSSGRHLLAHELTHVVQQGGTNNGTINPRIQRAMKFEFQTRNYVWKLGKTGKSPRPIGRKLGRYGKTEKGDEPSYLAVGEQGYPEVKVGDLIKAKKKEDYDPKKKSEYVVTYSVTRNPSGKVKLNGIPVKVQRLTVVNNRKKRKLRGKYNKGIYEFIYLDADNKNEKMDVHLINVSPSQKEPKGVFHFGKVKRMKKARKAGVKRGSKKEIVKESSAIELQSEERGFIEFETPKWFSSWCALKLRIKEAERMALAIKGSAPVPDADNAIKDSIERQIPRLISRDKRWSQHNTIGTLKQWPSTVPIDKLPLSGGSLIVEEVDPSWEAYIQHSEDIALAQYENLLREQSSVNVDRIINQGKEILNSASISPAAYPNLYNFLLMISRYIEYGQARKEDERKDPAKYQFHIMSRTSFSSIYKDLLSGYEQGIFKKLVKEGKIITALNKINPALSLNNSSRVIKHGHGGGRLGPTIKQWLKSIMPRIKGKGKSRKEVYRRDTLSPLRGGSAAMGRFEVENEAGKNDTGLVKFEVRRRGGNRQVVTKWADYAEQRFKEAAARGGDPERKKAGTDLNYSKDCKDTYFEQKAQEAFLKDLSKKLKEFFGIDVN